MQLRKWQDLITQGSILIIDTVLLSENNGSYIESVAQLDS